MLMLQSKHSESLSHMTNKATEMTCWLCTAPLHPYIIRSQEFVCSCCKVSACSRSLELNMLVSLEQVDDCLIGSEQGNLHGLNAGCVYLPHLPDKLQHRILVILPSLATVVSITLFISSYFIFSDNILA